MPRVLYRDLRFRIIDRCLRDQHQHYHLRDIAEVCNQTLFEAFGVKVSLRTVQYDLAVLRQPPFSIELDESLLRLNVYRYADLQCTVPFVNDDEGEHGATHRDVEHQSGKVYKLYVADRAQQRFEQQLLSYGADLEVLSPSDLRQTMRDSLIRMLHNYE